MNLSRGRSSPRWGRDIRRSFRGNTWRSSRPARDNHAFHARDARGARRTASREPNRALAQASGLALHARKPAPVVNDEVVTCVLAEGHGHCIAGFLKSCIAANAVRSPTTFGCSTWSAYPVDRMDTGHRHPAVVEAIKEQADRYLHQGFFVGMYEPYVEVCKRLADLSACSGREQRSLLVNAGAEAVENAVKIARVATGRPAVVVFDYAFHGRTLLSMTMTSKVVPYKRGFGPFAPEVYRAPAPYPYRGVTTDDAIEARHHLFKG